MGVNEEFRISYDRGNWRRFSRLIRLGWQPSRNWVLRRRQLRSLVSVKSEKSVDLIESRIIHQVEQLLLSLGPPRNWPQKLLQATRVSLLSSSPFPQGKISSCLRMRSGYLHALTTASPAPIAFSCAQVALLRDGYFCWSLSEHLRPSEGHLRAATEGSTWLWGLSYYEGYVEEVSSSLRSISNDA